MSDNTHRVKHLTIAIWFSGINDQLQAIKTLIME